MSQRVQTMSRRVLCGLLYRPCHSEYRHCHSACCADCCIDQATARVVLVWTAAEEPQVVSLTVEGGSGLVTVNETEGASGLVTVNETEDGSGTLLLACVARGVPTPTLSLRKVSRHCTKSVFFFF